MSKFTKIDRNIAAGEAFEHNGSVEILGNIEEGASIIIHKGGLIVRGNIGAEVEIMTTCHRNTPAASVFNDVSSIVHYPQADIQIDGFIGNNVTIKSNGSTSLKRLADNHLNVITRGAFTAPYIGSFSSITSGLASIIEDTGNCADITSLGHAQVAHLGHRSSVRGLDVSVNEADTYCNIIAKRFAKVKEQGDDCYVRDISGALGTEAQAPRKSGLRTNIFPGNRSRDIPFTGRHR